jgi:hypothetical protein
MNTYYRGGPSLAARLIDVTINQRTGLVAPTRGVSVFDQPNGLERFGGAHEVGPIPATLKIVKTGRNPHHFEIAPAFAMTLDAYQAELAKVALKPV